MALIEIKYFNSFVLKRTVARNARLTQSSDTPSPLRVWNGSFGIPKAIGGFEQSSDIYTDPTTGLELPLWIVEESRIKAGYNNTSTDYGVRAYIVEEEADAVDRFNSLIYSGIFNSRTGINQTNVFSVGEDITRSLSPSDGGIQKLYAEDTNLTIFQESKVSRALIDKDAIYSAEGGGTVTSSNLVIGAIQPYLGNYGMGNHPESFATYGYKKYFVDTYQNTVMRLDQSGLFEISNYGMDAFFRTQIGQLDSAGGKGKIIGGWDIYNKEYVLSIQPSDVSLPKSTLSYDDRISGWTSFYSYVPSNIFSVRNNFYTTTGGSVYRHYSQVAQHGNFYGTRTPSSVTFVFNPSPNISKDFLTLNYEGSNGWQVDNIISSETGPGTFTSASDSVSDLSQGNPTTNPTIWSYDQGSYDNFNNVFPAALIPPINHAGFTRKENKYCSNIINSTPASEGEIIFGKQISGIKGFFTTVTMSTDNVTDVGGYKELFAVSSNFNRSNGF
tara:strand:+ start:342 stop:1838 length:1497 start_codon:yes stop_codon:yes gene_type:complete